jgi:hypothetical protein
MAESTIVLKDFCDFSEAMQAAVAKTIKDEMEQRTRIQTKEVSEWVRVLTLGNTKLEIDYVARKMNVEAKSKELLEILTREYLLVGLLD